MGSLIFNLTSHQNTQLTVSVIKAPPRLQMTLNKNNQISYWGGPPCLLGKNSNPIILREKTNELLRRCLSGSIMPPGGSQGRPQSTS